MDSKVFNDSIHGLIEFDPVLIKIIDTPQFQRLRSIKQLGGGYYVFPGAAHNRFEHSLGVCYLAGEFALSLRSNQEELGITNEDILCVKIAGLCHDLGHGPFSHVSDQLFTTTKHETLSVKMFNYLLEEKKGIRLELTKCGLEEKDFWFIERLILGLPRDKQTDEEWLKNGRGREKSFLFEIVANKRNGIDVDKWDYFARDCHNLGIANSFDHKRYMKFARVIEEEGERQICMRDKEVNNVYDMFYTRFTLHRRAYQHKVKRIIEKMIAKALKLADRHLKIFPQADGNKMTMSESLGDMHAYTHVTDSVLEYILMSQEGDLKESKDIIQKIRTRQHYKYVGQILPAANMELEPLISEQICQAVSEEDLKEPQLHPNDLVVDDPKEISKAICQAVSEEDLKGPQLHPDDLVVDVVKMDYGMGNQNPVDYVRFYSKENSNIAKKISKGEVSQMLPVNFLERYIRVYCKNRDAENVAKAERCFAEWCDKMKFSKPKPGNFLDLATTPSDSKKRHREDRTRRPPDAPKKSKKSLDDTYKSME